VGWSLLGTGLWASAFTLVGFAFHESFSAAAGTLTHGALGAAVLLAGVLTVRALRARPRGSFCDALKLGEVHRVARADVDPPAVERHAAGGVLGERLEIGGGGFRHGRAAAGRGAGRGRSRSASAHPPKHNVPAIPVAESRTPAAAASAMPFVPRMSTTAAAPHAGSERELAEGDERDEDGDGVEERGIDADRLQREPVARDLSADGEKDEREDARPARRGCGELRARSTGRSCDGGDDAQPRHGGDRSPDAQHGRPPRQAQRAEEGEGGQRRERCLDREDGNLGGKQRRGTRAGGGRGPP
jgi:hypothetical protein